MHRTQSIWIAWHSVSLARDSDFANGYAVQVHCGMRHAASRSQNYAYCGPKQNKSLAPLPRARARHQAIKLQGRITRWEW